MSSAPASASASPRWLGALLLALGSGYAALFFHAVHASMPFNAIQLAYVKGLELPLFLPESWKFFTRNPREEQPLAFRHDGARWNSATPAPHGAAVNLFGLSRVSRARWVELGMLLQSVPRGAWSPCHESPAMCLERLRVSGRVRNGSPHPSLCGPVGIATQPPVPWAWSGAAKHVTMPSRVVRLEVEC
jgi:antimicrobial peptide system SdpA family protein